LCGARQQRQQTIHFWAMIFAESDWVEMGLELLPYRAIATAVHISVATLHAGLKDYQPACSEKP
jgi:hypothetical protein